jgi:hypothetical protein
MHGVLSYIPTRRPTAKELCDCDRYELTSAEPWDHYGISLGSDKEQGPYTIASMHSRPDPPEIMEGAMERMISSLSLTNTSIEPHKIDVIAHDQSVPNITVATISCSGRGSIIMNQELAKRWHIGPEAAARTLKCTTQEGMRFVRGWLERRLRISQAHLCYPSLNVTIYSDTLFPSLKSVRGFTCAQLFTDGHCFAHVYPLKRKGDAHYALVQFIQDVGIPKGILTDCAPEEMRGE